MRFKASVRNNGRIVIALAVVLTGLLVIPFEMVHAAVGLVSFEQQDTAGEPYATCTFPTVTAGNVMIVGVHGISVSIVSVTDSYGNNYVLQKSLSVSSAVIPSLDAIYTTMIAASVSSLVVTATFSTVPSPGTIECSQWSGLLSPTATQIATGQGTINSGSSATYSTGSMTPGAQDLVISSASLPACLPGTTSSEPFPGVFGGTPQGNFGFSTGTAEQPSYCGGNGVGLWLAESYTISSAGSPTTTPWTQAWSGTWNTGSANWTEITADFTVATFTSTTTVSTSTSTTTVCTSTSTSTATATATTISTKTVTTTTTVG